VPLSEREREVLELVATGATNSEIGRRLFLSRHTVKEHTSALYRKLEVRNRAEAVQRAQRMGLIG
jgi:two-component system response regulator DesR